MGLERKLDVPVGDLSVIRGMWEVRVKKHRQRQKKEQQRVENSALARIDQQWQYRIYCKTLKSHELNLLHRYLERSTLPDTQPRTDEDQLQDPQDPDQSRLILQLDGDRWTSFPRELQWKTYLREWHVRGTRIHQLPDFLALFTQLTVLEIPKNAIAELPPEIGKLTELRELNVSYNRLSRVPPELGHCENLQRLELRGNHNLSELSFEKPYHTPPPRYDGTWGCVRVHENTGHMILYSDLYPPPGGRHEPTHRSQELVFARTSDRT
ncbi:putative leucine-rich repeat-containing protein 2-like [Scophthalmus maximus]|uniref:Putative leucine-rich repeat-containing protein 2-like n=1 Tax=Scophthalmus maximus TaxID=52904 RepID=A0A2U9BX64_SCOMX|nr:putative leucine-rich repeat-containing protein 2-like [Scophthalmus maximus]